MLQHKIIIQNQLSELETIATTLETVGENWDLSMSITLNLNLVLEELITNIIFYGYTDKNEHFIEINIDFDDSRIFLKVEDDGIAFNPLLKEEADISLPVEERAIGGLGIHFVRKIMDTISYERKNEKNILTMIKTVK
ncbi:MAG: RsbW [Bacteroidetes bacterium]|nr:MAG: RsbW [Bacteroidota bacterium]